MINKQPFGPVMLDVEGLSLAPHEAEMLNHPNTGAVILFSRNYENPEQIAELIKAIRKARQGNILIAVDQEGGRVQRFKAGFTRLPAAALYSKTPDLCEAAGWLMAIELLAVGIDFSFAPVLDIDCGVSQIIGDRSFGTDTALATKMASHFMKGMHSAGMAATGKHFPGHGAVALDSHLTLPIDERDITALRQKDFIPFKQLISEGLEGIMPAHVLYPNIDSQQAGFSNFWIQKILREELNFNGTVFSDDLSMAGAATAGGFADRAKQAHSAGCDMLLVCNNTTAASEVLDKLPIIQDTLREERLSRMIGVSNDTLHYRDSLKWQQTVAQLNQLIEHNA